MSSASEIVWVSMSDLAARKNVTPQAVAKRVSALEKEGRLTTRKDGRRRLVNMAEYDQIVGEIGDSIKEAAAASRDGERSKIYRDAQAERAAYDAEMAGIKLAEKRGDALPVKGPYGIQQAALKIAEETAIDIDGITRHANDLAASVGKDGASGARKLLKSIARDLRRKMSERLSGLAAVAAEAEMQGILETELND